MDGDTFPFEVAAAAPNEVPIGATAAATASNLATVLNAWTGQGASKATYTANAAVVSILYGAAIIYGTDGNKSVEGNSFTLGAGTAGAKVTLSGATLSGGVDATSKSVNVVVGTGIDLLTIAKELRLHPVAKPDADNSEDFVIPLAGTPGALKFAYKLEDERIYDCEFTGYPDAAGNLFYIGR